MGARPAMSVDNPDRQRIHLLRLGDPVLDTVVDRYEELHSLGSSRHILVDDPGDAELAMFTQPTMLVGDPGLRTLRRHPAWRRHRDRTYVVDFRDRPWCALPGLYTCMPARYLHPRWQRPCLYPWVTDPGVIEGRFRPLRAVAPRRLAFFVGATTHPCRSALASLHSEAIVVEAASQTLTHERRPDARDRFDDLMAQSMFVLCPRGHGTGTFRVQEALAAGRIPVIISDDWAPPAGVDWATISVRWPEGSTAGLAAHLQSLAEHFPVMSAAAAAAYDRWWAVDRAFDTVIEQLSLIHRDRRGRPFPRRGIRDRWYARLCVSRAAARVRGLR
jgi:Exostosin family